MRQMFLGKKFIITSVLVLVLLSPVIIVTASFPVSTDGHNKSVDSDSWQEYSWEQQQDQIRQKKKINSAESNEKRIHVNTGEDNSSKGIASSTTSNLLQLNQGGYRIKGNGDVAVVLEYVCMPQPDKCPILKTYHMYYREPEDGFYPSWSYFGFSPPSEWHNVQMKYFEAPPLKLADERENYNVRKHGSAMHLCTEENTDNVEKCKRMMRNECISNMPSPINILTHEAVQDEQLLEFDFINYNVFFGFEMFFETDGSQLLFVKLLPRDDGKGKPGIRGGPLASNNELFLDRIIFRVGFEPGKGSEHSLDGNYFGMEIQFVFTSEDLPYWQILSRYKLLPEFDSRIGQQVHVVSVFVNVTDDDEKKDAPDGSPLTGNSMEVLSLAAEMFWQGENKNSYSLVRVAKKVFTLEDFFSEPKRGIYYTYQGSLSHPPCLTNVGWTVFEKPIWIKFEQWTRFIYVHAEFSDQQYIAGNIRPQSLIQIKPDIETFRKMKNVEGYGDLRQTELDEAGENTRLPMLRGSISNSSRSDKNNTDSDISYPEPLYLIRNYVDFQKYFAQQVRKSRHGAANSREIYDYLDGDGRPRSSSAATGATTCHYFRTLIVCTTVSWWMTMKFHL